MTNHIHVSSTVDAWKAAQLIVKDYTKDSIASDRAGYPICRSESEYYTYICDLADRLEVNLTNGDCYNIWIDTVKEEPAKPEIHCYRYICDCGGNDVFVRYDYTALPIERFITETESTYNLKIVSISEEPSADFESFQKNIYKNLLQGVQFGACEARFIEKLVSFETV